MEMPERASSSRLRHAAYRGGVGATVQAIPNGRQVARPNTYRRPTRVTWAEGDRPEWWARAACLGRGPDRWFPTRTGPKTPPVECSYCPVRVQCLRAALANREEDGWWGGLSTEARGPLLALVVTVRLELVSGPGPGPHCRDVIAAAG